MARGRMFNVRLRVYWSSNRSHRVWQNVPSSSSVHRAETPLNVCMWIIHWPALTLLEVQRSTCHSFMIIQSSHVRFYRLDKGDHRWCKNPSIHFLYLLIPILEPIAAVIGRQAGYTLDRSGVRITDSNLHDTGRLEKKKANVSVSIFQSTLSFIYSYIYKLYYI